MPSSKSQAVLVDTSAWIEFLRPKAVISEAMRDAVQTCLESGAARICGVVIAELLQGAKGSKEIDQLRRIFDMVPNLPMQETDWRAAGLKLQQLKSQGKSAPITDAVIAAIAERNRLSVLTLDKHFDLLMP